MYLITSYIGLLNVDIIILSITSWIRKQNCSTKPVGELLLELDRLSGLLDADEDMEDGEDQL